MAIKHPPVKDIIVKVGNNTPLACFDVQLFDMLRTGKWNWYTVCQQLARNRYISSADHVENFKLNNSSGHVTIAIEMNEKLVPLWEPPKRQCWCGCVAGKPWMGLA